jgi:crotonobetainyl-CoA:carnitine CoA-transferase CaiB-like acyl-CoA transferase
LPLNGIRIIAIEQYGAGPFGSLQLADLGAEIIKIEDPRTDGDVGRTVPPYAVDGDSLYFEALNRGKRSITLDLTNASGRAVFERLVGASDGLISNLRGDVPERLGLTYEALRHANERLVCCSLSAFGRSGAYAKLAGYDYLLQGIAGWMSMTGEPGGPPTKTGPSVIDWASGLCAGLALVSGLIQAERTGQGGDCDIALFDVAVGMLGYVATWHLTKGYDVPRRANSAHPSIVPFQNFQTADGYVVVACPKEKFWRALMPAVGLERLQSDARFASFQARLANEAELLEELEPVFKTRNTSEWVQVLQAAEVPCAPVNTICEGLQAYESMRGPVLETSHPRFGVVRHPAPIFRHDDSLPRAARAPRLDEHRLDILRELGYSDDEVKRLEGAGAFGA